MIKEYSTQRRQQRLGIKLPVRVAGECAALGPWAEVAETIDLTPLGARLILRHPVEVGQPLHLTLDMPPQLRLYDRREPYYRVWAVARFVRPLRLFSGRGAQTQQNEVGVALVGKLPPEGSQADPALRYSLTPPPAESEFWGIRLTTQPT